MEEHHVRRSIGECQIHGYFAGSREGSASIPVSGQSVVQAGPSCRICCLVSGWECGSDMSQSCFFECFLPFASPSWLLHPMSRLAGCWRDSCGLLLGCRRQSSWGAASRVLFLGWLVRTVVLLRNRKAAIWGRTRPWANLETEDLRCLFLDKSIFGATQSV